MKKQTPDLRPLIAVSRELPSTIELIEASLDALAKMHARETGLPIAQAYDDLLMKDECMRELYSDLRAARRDPAIIAKRREDFGKRQSSEKAEPWASDAERKLDELAEEQANGKGETKAEAYDQVLRTEEGRELYAKHRAKRRALSP